MDALTIERYAPAPEAQQPTSAELALGVTRGMTNEQYHEERSAVSSRQLKQMLTSPAHYLHHLDSPEESRESLLFGAVLHGRLLEPNAFERRFFAEPKVNRTTKEGKALAEGFKIEAAGRTRFPADWMAQIDAIVGNVAAHAKAREIPATEEAEVVLA